MKKYIILILFTLSTIIVNSQISSGLFEKPQVTHQAPNISSLGEYGKFPVGHYSGTPNISIPLYEINLDGLKIPVQLSYNASGIRVSQEASWVGLGWSLQVGGTITKEIRGWNDFYENNFSNPNTPTNDLGYYMNNWTVPTWPQRTASNEIIPSYGNTTDFEKIIAGFDTQPDMFHFNFGSYSGTMYFDRKDKVNLAKTAKPIVHTPSDYLDIVYNISERTWNITDQYGFKYNFESAEFSEVYDESSQFYLDAFYKDRNKIPKRKKMPNVLTAWYLTSVISPKGKKITFHYEKEEFATPVMLSEPLLLSGHTEWITRSHIHNFNYSYSKMTQLVLKKIEFSEGSIIFQTSERKDLESIGRVPQKLDLLEVKNQLGNSIKKYKFSYSYMGNASDFKNCRLKLDLLSEENGNIKNPPYKFAYIPGTLPDKNSFDSDVWGFYNGPGRSIEKIGMQPDGLYLTKTLPPVLFSPKNPTVLNLSSSPEVKYSLFKLYMTGGRRAVPDFSYTGIGTLNKIEYPTGGYSQFVYEPHTFDGKYSLTEGYTVISRINYDKATDPNPNNPVLSANEFTLNKGTYVFLDMSHRYPLSDNIPDRFLDISILYKHKESGKMYPLISEGYLCTGRQGVAKGKNIYYLHPGTYQLRINKEINPGTGLALEYKQQFVISVMYLNRETSSNGGGLRIKEIHNMDNGKLMTKKRYSYLENGKTSGLLLSTPDFFNMALFDAMGASSTTFIEANKLGENVMKQAYVSPHASISGGSTANVVYKYVEEFDEDSKGNILGKTTHKFFAERATRILLPGFPVMNHRGNGSLLETREYTGTGSLVRKITKTYLPGKGQVDKLVEGLAVHESESRLGSKFYDLKSERWMLNNERIAEYFNNGKDSIINLTNYHYDPVYWTLNKIETTGSKSDKREEITKYPFNFTDAMNTKMKSRNMVGIQIEKISINNNLVVSGSKAVYIDTLGIYLPKIIQKLNINSPVAQSTYSQHYQEEFRYVKYDKQGNILQLTGRDNIPLVYIWGYNDKYPVAEITGATYDQVKAALGVTPESLSSASEPNMTLINGLRQKLLGALVTTYTYKPLVGISTMTDPRGIVVTYEYDTFGRLLQIKDTNGKVLQHYKYNFRTQ